jgi:hypothetical protein
MKLLYCPHCSDIRKLHTLKKVWCRCGLSSAFVFENHWHAEYYGEAVPLGVANQSFNSAIVSAACWDAWKNNPKQARKEEDLFVTSWVFAPDAPRIVSIPANRSYDLEVKPGSNLLFFCSRCSDGMQVSKDKRSCSCGCTSAQQLDNGDIALATAGLLMSIDLPSLYDATRAFLDYLRSTRIGLKKESLLTCPIERGFKFNAKIERVEVTKNVT